MNKRGVLKLCFIGDVAFVNRSIFLLKTLVYKGHIEIPVEGICEVSR